MKVVVGLGNPGARYDDTRHNVGWWLIDRLAFEWGFPAFSGSGPALVSESVRGEEHVRLVKPTTFMNRSGAAIAVHASDDELRVERDLMVVVDDATLDVGKARLRARGSAGGHNGLRSVEEVLGHQEYARMRIGVGVAPPGEDLVEWVLSPMPPEDEEVVLRVILDGVEALRIWMEDGIEAAMNRFNR